MSWSPQQSAALQAIEDWHEAHGEQVFYLAGFAGTGKTTLAKHIAAGVSGQVMFGAFTGKAALVLRQKGCDGASTLHSMLYKPREVREKGPNGAWVTRVTFDLNSLADVALASLVIVDECSMVDERLGRDLLSFGTKVLVLGDPAQLPPVRGEGFFTAGAPDFMLTEIHRQAAENPIIRMSMDVREGRRLRRGAYGDSAVIGQRDLPDDERRRSNQILCGMNRSRRTLNAMVRTECGFDPDRPEVGDRLVCLRNNHQKGLLNGGLWKVDEVLGFDDDGVRLMVQSLDDPDRDPIRVYVRREFFHGEEDKLEYNERRNTDEFTYGYALTVHKSQGSQWDRVLVYDESFAFRENRSRHLYTALTRAANAVTVVQH
ncbi:ATP-dependent RecD-like DNA helicase [Methylobacterium sp. NEAU 140]|uniref:ATP-dependent DNA helicase n=1 Tax=Methylobacterium sp. NEAU 140 TaxID=3064945 RepID=UPI002733B7C4|nr:ATP-dependent RecD-like DNA helicase [Methylobacterium sp. NEAU 140]MDP4024440.1 ATP-dependent RecD-like DNA helicase [Methylobacterium sp. NEAU 140]